VRAALAGVLLTLMPMSPAWGAAAQPPPPPGAPPRLLNVVRVRVKPKSAGVYTSLEGQIVRAYDRAKVRLYWICLQSPRDPTDVVYLNLYNSADGPDRAAATYHEAVEPHPDILSLQQRLADVTASSTSTLTTRRDDIDRAVAGADFATLRTLRLTTFQVQPGREGEFIRVTRTASPKDGAWLVYEANNSSTFMLITLKKTPINRRDGPPIPRTLRRAKGLYVASESRVYNVRQAMSHVSPAFMAAHPSLWRLP
jgi:hypothetical protein